MATLLRFSSRHGVTAIGNGSRLRSLRSKVPQQYHRSFQTSTGRRPDVADFAFAFDIDGVLLRSSKPLPRAGEALRYLQRQRVPFILLTNGGGKSETDRVAELSALLQSSLSTDMFVQSHTPFAQLVHGDGASGAPLRDKCVLVVGGDGNRCREVAENYGFTNVLTPADLIVAFPALWPFTSPKSYASYARPLRQTLSSKDFSSSTNDQQRVKVDAIFVFNDPRDWALDTQIILDLLLSHAGYLGSMSPKNGDRSLPNHGYQQDDQPPLYFSNPDLFWAAEYHLPRLGQGGFREAFEGVWQAATGGETGGVRLEKTVIGKPYQKTYEFAERKLQRHKKELLGVKKGEGKDKNLKTVYMVGDNPESDIRGANSYNSPAGTQWESILVRSGVYSHGKPAHSPKTIVDNVWHAVEWAFSQEGRLVGEDSVSNHDGR